MEYRRLGRTDFAVSEVGLGCEYLEGKPAAQVNSVIAAALARGITILDVFMAEPNVRTHIGEALRGKRSQVFLQGHIGAGWFDGQYSRTRKLAENRFFVEDFLRRLQTDWIDIGMIHFVDTAADYNAVFATELIDYVLKLREQGAIRAVGLSSHNPVIARQAVETGLIDVLMFSINPAYDLLPANTTIEQHYCSDTYTKRPLLGMDPKREQLYKACELHQTGITVMKALGSGTLLKPELSPFGQALTVNQCIHYALDRPAAASALIGCATTDELEQAADYEQAGAQERAYAQTLAGTTPYANTGRCMYCNHCLPCPVKIDIAQVMKYLDLAEAAAAGRIQHDHSAALTKADVPGTIGEHYRSLARHASDCTACGQCEQRCPFHVPVQKRMERARQLLG